MDFCKKREFDLLNRIGFVRYGGSPEELKAANILLEEMKDFGVNGVLEAFHMPWYEIDEVQLEVLEPYHKEYTVRGYGLTGNTPIDGLTAPFAYVEQAEKIDLINVKGKIVMFNGALTPFMLRDMIKAGAVGFVSFCGTVVDDIEKTDIEMRVLRDTHLKFGKIPGVTLKVADALEMVKNGASKVKLLLRQTESVVESHNVIAEINGTDYPDEVVAFCAHYDSTPFSNGVYDNGGGTVIIMELMRYFAKNPPKRTLRFIWLGSEERGLCGSKYYTDAHRDELSKIQLLINVDMAGPPIGRDRAIITGDISMKHVVEYLSAEMGHPVITAQEAYSSDSTSFADKGVPAISFARFGADGTSPGHNRYDIIEHLTAESLIKTTQFVAVFAQRVINSAVFPVPRTMPDNMLEALDRYVRRWDKDK